MDKTYASCKGVPLGYSGPGFESRRGQYIFHSNFQSLHLNKSSISGTKLTDMLYGPVTYGRIVYHT